MAMNIHPAYNNSYGDGYVRWDGVDSSYYAYSGAGSRQGRELSSEEAYAGWICFDPVNEANGAAPEDAFIVLQQRSLSGKAIYALVHEEIDILIYGIDEDDHAYPTSTATWDTDHGLATSASVSDKEYWWYDGCMWFSKDVSSIVTEIAARGGWAANQAMGFHLLGAYDQQGGSDVSYIEYEDDTATRRPRLCVAPSSELWPRPIGVVGEFQCYGMNAQGADALPVLYPPDMLVGETLLMWMAIANSADVTLPDGWVKLTETDNGTAVTLCVAYRKVDGTEGDYFHITFSSEVAGVECNIMRVTNAADPSVSPPEISAPATGTSANPDPSSISPAAGSKKYMAIAIEASDGYRDATAIPSGYDGIYYTEADGVQCDIGWGVGWVESDTINPDAFTIAASEEWVAATIIVHPATGATSYYRATQGGVWGVAG